MAKYIYSHLSLMMCRARIKSLILFRPSSFTYSSSTQVMQFKFLFLQILLPSILQGCVASTGKLQVLENFLRRDLPTITYVTPNSPNYMDFRAIFALDNQAAPLAIVRPRTAEHVAKIIKFAHSQNIDVAVRAGGHEYEFARSTPR